MRSHAEFFIKIKNIKFLAKENMITIQKLIHI